MFFCELCKYRTSDRRNYKKHLNTKKHLLVKQYAQPEFNEIKEDTNNNDNEVDDRKFTCQYCDKSFTTQKYHRKHEKYHCVEAKKIQEIEEKIETNNLIRKLVDKIEEKDKAIIEEKNKVEKILVEGAKQMKKNNDKIYKMSMKNQDSFKFILEHFQDAPDAFFPEDIEEKLLENMAKYMDMDNPVTAISKAFLDFIPKQPQEKRFIHGIDISRVKYVVKKDGKWNVDYYGKDVIPKFVYHFKKSCGKFVEGEMKRIEGPKIYDRIAFLDKLDSKILSNKVARNVSHDLQLNKTTYLRKMIELQAMKTR